MKDTEELLKLNRSFFGGTTLIGSMSHTQANFSRPHKITFVLCNPRSGSTLLMRLMNIACLSHMVGDHAIKSYQGLIDIHQDLKEDNQYGDAIDLEKSFKDEYRGSSYLRDVYVTRLATRLSLFKDHGSGYHKSTIIGWSNDLVVPFVEMLRDYFDSRDTELTIGFLTRKPEDIISSFQTSDGPGKDVANRIPEIYMDLIERQNAQFKEAYELGDVLMTYDDVVNNTEKTLIKLSPLYRPNISAMNKVLSNKLRER